MVLLVIRKFKIKVDFEHELGEKVILDILNEVQGSNKCVCCAGTVLSGKANILWCVHMHLQTHT